MSKKNKLALKIFTKPFPTDIKSSEIETAVGGFGFNEVKSGRTSGSSTMYRDDKGNKISIHKAHANEPVKQYVIRDIKKLLENYGYL